MIQIGKEELQEIIQEAIRAAMPKAISTAMKEPLINGIHVLAKFLNVCPSRAQKLKNGKIITDLQDGRNVLFDPEEVRNRIQECSLRRGGKNGR